jgi:hypothetical protein
MAEPFARLAEWSTLQKRMKQRLIAKGNFSSMEKQNSIYL